MNHNRRFLSWVHQDFNLSCGWGYHCGFTSRLRIQYSEVNGLTKENLVAIQKKISTAWGTLRPATPTGTPTVKGQSDLLVH